MIGPQKNEMGPATSHARVVAHHAEDHHCQDRGAHSGGRCRDGAGHGHALPRGQAILSQPEVMLGLVPPGTATVRLPRLMGRSRALEILLGCEDFNADLAERYGFINRALDADEIGPFVEDLANRIASFPTETLILTKKRHTDRRVAYSKACRPSSRWPTRTHKRASSRGGATATWGPAARRGGRTRPRGMG